MSTLYDTKKSSTREFSSDVPLAYITTQSRYKLTESTVELFGFVFEEEDIPPLADALKNNDNLGVLDFTFTNLTDEWFTVVAKVLLEKSDDKLKKLTLIINETCLTRKSLPLLEQLKNTIKNLEVSGNYLILEQALKNKKTE